MFRPSPPRSPLRRGVAIGGEAPATARCQAERAAPAPDLSATAATGAPNAVNGVPTESSIPDGVPASHQPISPAIEERSGVPPSGRDVGSGPARRGRPGAAITTLLLGPARITLIGARHPTWTCGVLGDWPCDGPLRFKAAAFCRGVGGFLTDTNITGKQN